MKVALTHPYSWPEVRRGAERIIVETARALARRGHDVTVLTAGSSPGRVTVDGWTQLTYRRRFDDSARHERWFAARIVPRLVTGRYDVVHSLMPRDAVTAIRTRPIARHLTVYEELGIPIVSWWNGPDREARLRVVEDVDVYGCMSRFALDVLRRDTGRDGALIPGGVRVDQFAPEGRETNPTILFSGTLDEPRKGVGLLLEALALVARTRPDVRLWLSGPGDAQQWLARAPDAAVERTTVLPLGAPHEQGHRYARAWVTALPSVNESFGMVLVESLACGTPIVVSDHSAPPELVTPETGATCRPEDAASLAEALERALSLAEDPATANRCRAFAHRYDWDDAIAPQLEAIYAGGPARR